MRSELQADIRRYHRSPESLSAGRALRLIVDHFGLQVLVIYRVGRWLGERARATGRWPWRLLLPLTRIASRLAGRMYGIYLDPDVPIGPGLYIGHSGGIHLSGCRLGAGCSIHQRVRIVAAAGEERGPVIGDGVWIGCHADIRGALRVGDFATIGAGTVVRGDVPERALVLGSPSRIVRRDYDNAAMR